MSTDPSLGPLCPVLLVLLLSSAPARVQSEAPPAGSEGGAPSSAQGESMPAPVAQQDSFNEWLAILDDILPTWRLYGDFAWLPSSDVDENDESVELHEMRFRVGRRIRLTDSVSLNVGASYAAREIHAPDEVGLPDALYSISANLGVLYRPFPEVLLAFLLDPGVRSDLEDVGGDDIRVPFTAATAYTFSPRLILVGGLFVTGNHHRNAVLPLIGLLWRPHDDWTLRISPLSPTVIYRTPVQGLRLYAGGQFNAGEYEIDDDSPAGDAIIYRDYRVRAGFLWSPRYWAHFDLSGGLAFARKFTYFDGDSAENDIHLDAAPFVAGSVTIFIW